MYLSWSTDRKMFQLLFNLSYSCTRFTRISTIQQCQ